MFWPPRRPEEIAETLSELIEWLTEVRLFFEPQPGLGPDCPDWLKPDLDLNRLDPDFLRDCLRSYNYEKLDDLVRLELIMLANFSWLWSVSHLLARVNNDLRSHAGWREDEVT